MKRKKHQSPQKDPITKPGDIWTLGGHRLTCGDCTREDHVRAVVADSWPPDLLLTDPPYCSGGFQEAGRSRLGVSVLKQSINRLPTTD